jgi:hypothetical protein
MQNIEAAGCDGSRLHFAPSKLSTKSEASFGSSLVLHSPESVLSEALAVYLWASEFSTVPRSQKIGILGGEGFGQPT